MPIQKMQNNQHIFPIRGVYKGSGKTWEGEFVTETISLKQIHTVEELIDILRLDSDIDIVVLEVDSEELDDLIYTIKIVKGKNARIHMVSISEEFKNKTVMKLMRAGIDWHFSHKAYKSLPEFDKQVREEIFFNSDWNIEFQRSQERRFPQLEFGLMLRETNTPSNQEKTLEEEYILKELFPNSHTIYVFKLTSDEQGLSGARVYRVQADDETMRIVKIETLSGITTIEEKFEKLIRPRINQYIGRLEPNLVRAKSQGGAKYILAGSYDDFDVISIKKFMSDRDSRYVRPSTIKELMRQLHGFLRELYKGHVEDRQTLFWAEFYTRILPPQLVISEAEFAVIANDAQSNISENESSFALNKNAIVIHSENLKTHMAVYEQQKLIDVKFQELLITDNTDLVNSNKAETISDTKQVSSEIGIEIFLKDFEITELDPDEMKAYVQDEVSFRRKAGFLEYIDSKDLPLMRIKIEFKEDSQKKHLFDPILRKGKKINVWGKAKFKNTQKEILRENINKAYSPLLGNSVDDSEIVEIFDIKFLNPLYASNLFLWEIGKEDFIRPAPIFSPVIHGDLNFKNILISIGKNLASENLRVWLIDFADARPGHMFFDLAKVETEFRTLILSEIFKELVDEGHWTVDVALRASLLIEHVLHQKIFNNPDNFSMELSKFSLGLQGNKNWFDVAEENYSIYWKDLLLFLAEVRKTVYSFGTQLGTYEQFKAHYPVALFFLGLAALKFSNLEENTIFPWSKRLPLIQSLVASNKIIKEVEGRNSMIQSLRKKFRRPVSVAIIKGGENHGAYLLHNEKANGWKGFFLMGGQQNTQHKNSPIALENQILEENRISREQYSLHREPRIIPLTQFSETSRAFQEYEFYVYTIKPHYTEPDWVDKYSTSEYELRWASLNEIKQGFFDDEEKTFISPTVTEIFDALNLFDD